MRKKLIFSIFVFLMIFTVGCKSEEVVVPVEKTGRATVDLSISVPDDDFNDTLYINFIDKGNPFNKFSVTLSRYNNYSIAMSIPMGVYEVESFSFSSGSDDFWLDLKELNIPEDKAYSFVSSVKESNMEIIDFKEGRLKYASEIAVGVVAVVVAAGIAIFLIRAYVKKNDKTSSKKNVKKEPSIKEKSRKANECNEKRGGSRTDFVKTQKKDCKKRGSADRIPTSKNKETEIAKMSEEQGHNESVKVLAPDKIKKGETVVKPVLIREDEKMVVPELTWIDKTKNKLNEYLMSLVDELAVADASLVRETQIRMLVIKNALNHLSENCDENAFRDFLATWKGQCVEMMQGMEEVGKGELFKELSELRVVFEMMGYEWGDEVEINEIPYHGESRKGNLSEEVTTSAKECLSEQDKAAEDSKSESPEVTSELLQELSDLEAELSAQEKSEVRGDDSLRVLSEESYEEFEEENSGVVLEELQGDIDALELLMNSSELKEPAPTEEETREETENSIDMKVYDDLINALRGDKDGLSHHAMAKSAHVNELTKTAEEALLNGISKVQDEFEFDEDETEEYLAEKETFTTQEDKGMVEVEEVAAREGENVDEKKKLLGFISPRPKPSQLELDMRKRRTIKVKLPKNIESLVPWLSEFDDGLFEISPNRFSKTIDFSGVSYRTAPTEEQIGFFVRWGDCLNYFGDGVEMSYTLNKHFISPFVPSENADGSGATMPELSMERYMTVSITAQSAFEASNRFLPIESDVLRKLGTVGCEAAVQDTDRRLSVLREFYQPQLIGRDAISWALMKDNKVSAKQFVRPWDGDIYDNHVIIDAMYYRAFFLNNLPSDVSDSILYDFTNFELPILATVTTKAADMDVVLDNAEAQLGQTEASVNTMSKKRENEIYKEFRPEDGRELVKNIQEQKQKMFYATVGVAYGAPSLAELDEALEKFASLAKEYGCQLQLMKYQQAEALKQILPLGHNSLQMKRSVSTENLCSYLPFTD